MTFQLRLIKAHGAMLGLHFVSKDILSREDRKTFHDLFEKRHSGDYDDFVFCDQEMVDELYPRAAKFIDDVKELLKWFKAGFILL